MGDRETSPKKFGRFEVEGVIGKGGMGLVYRARDPVIGRAVAIKVLRTEDDIGSQAREALQSRFEQEFRTAGTLSHPSVVTVYDVGVEGELSYIAMELVEGPSLQRLLESGESLNFDQILTIIQDLSEGLDHAHAAGVVHRDIKPANILFSKENRAKITDFGVAKVRTMNITMTGTLVGTPGYMAPEQILGRTITGACDQFALAVMVYQMLTGKMPFQANEPATILYKIAHEEPAAPHVMNSALPAALSPVVLKALSKDPNERFPTCGEFSRQLRFAAGRQTSRFVPRDISGATVEMDSDHTATRIGEHPATGGFGAPPGGFSATGATIPSGGGGPHSDVILHRPGGSTYAAPQSWWQRQSSGSRAGTIIGAIAVLGIAGWLSMSLLNKKPGTGDTESNTSTSATPGTDQPGKTQTSTTPAAPAEPKLFVINTEPPGAKALLDGQELPSPAPVNIELVPGKSYSLELKLDGYYNQKVVLETDKLENQVLSYQLKPVPPPGRLVVQASYPVSVQIDGRSAQATSSLEAGTYRVQLSAPSVFFSETRSVQVKAGETSTITLPATTQLRVIAIPANAEVVVDGDTGRTFEPPFQLEVVEGSDHSFRFVWPDGRIQEQRIVVRSNIEQIIGSPNRVETRSR